MIPIAGRGQRALLRFGAMEVVERFSRTVVGRKDWSNEGEPKVRLGWDGMDRYLPTKNGDLPMINGHFRNLNWRYLP